MKSFLITLGTVLLTLSLGTMQAQPQEYLTILHLNDTHSNLLAGSPRSSVFPYAGMVGGAARAATIVKSCYGGEYAPVLLHAGDAFIGDPMFNLVALPTQQSPDLQALVAMGCDAMALGNHEFDIGPDLLTGVLVNTFGLLPDYINDTDIPMLSANIDIPTDPMVYPMGAVLDAHVHPCTIVERGPFRIGVIGLTTPATNVVSDPSPVSFLGLTEAEIGQLMNNVGGIALDLVANRDCNFVILLSHMGMELDKVIATNVPLIDMIIGGHDHIATARPVNVHNAVTNKKVAIVQTEGLYRQIGKITLRLHNGMIDVHQYNLIDLDQSVTEDQDMLNALTPVAIALEGYIPGLFSTPVSSCSGTFTEAAPRLTLPGMKDTHVGNFVADAFQNVTGADIGIEPGGSTAQPLYAGPVLPVDIFRMIGYGANAVDGVGFPVVTFTITGAELAEGLEKTLANNEVDDEYLLQVSSNLQYFYDPAAAPGSRLKGVLFKGALLEMTTEYTVATNELVVMFLDMLDVEYTGLNSFPYVDSEFELVMGYILNGGITALPCGPKPGRIVALPSNALPAPFVNAPMAKITRNSPNPFIGETAVQFEVAENTPVTVKVYDVIGREIVTLYDGYAGGGVHTAIFNAAGLPSGLYFCRLLTADGAVQTLKMMKTR
ncbi:MAG: 5'-nucleotidase C-terminal domain-containing protein [Bacteroidota bacterium]|nr:5'-nucleotidase C-terminal domain-containing protein [Bacteroidota bacterium]